jgi:hypothetical protein
VRYFECVRMMLHAGLFFIGAICALSGPAVHQQLSAGMQMNMVMPSVAPLFAEGSGFSSTLHLINELKTTLVATIDVYAPSGRKMAQDIVSLNPNSAQEISVKSLLGAEYNGSQMGSILVSSDHPAGLLGAVTLTYHGKTDVYFDEELAMPSMAGSNMLRGVTDAEFIRSPIIAITSLAHSLQNVTVSCLREEGEPSSRIFPLRAAQTLFVSMCGTEEFNVVTAAADLENALRQSEKTKGSVGIAITSDGGAGEIAAYGIVPHREHDDPYFTSVNFVDPMMSRSSGTVYTGIPVGRSPLLADGEYRPELSITNFASRSGSLVIHAWSSSAHELGSKSIGLAAGETRTLALDLPPSPDLLTSLIIQTNLAPGDVAAKLIARSSTGPHVVELIGKAADRSENSGAHPWNVADGLASILFVFNHDPKEQIFNVRFGTSVGPWIKSYKLGSMETRAISINELIAAEERDDNGRPFPADATSGEVGWYTPASGEVTGRMLQANRDSGLARNFSCGQYTYVCAAALSPYTSTDILEGQTGELGDIIPDFCIGYGGPPSGCYSDNSPTSQSINGITYSWTPGNTSISKISGSSTSAISYWTTVSGGSTQGNYAAIMPYFDYQCTGLGPIRVHVPYQVEPVATLSSSSNTCSSGAGWFRYVTNQLEDQWGAPYKVSGLTLSDNITVQTPNALGISGTQTGSFPTNAQGQWADSYFDCSGACPASTGSADAIQQWSVNGVGLPHTNLVVYKCSSITIDGH